MSKLKTIINNKKIPIILYVVIISSLNIFQCIRSHYYVVDDVMMSRIANGGLNVKPNEHLIFINVIVGKMLNLLYSIYEGINWFELLYICLSIVCTTLVFVIFSNHINRWISLIVSIVLDLFIVNYFTFTTFGFICTTIGIIGIIDYLPKVKKRFDRNSIVLTICLVSFFFGQMMREKAWIMAIIITLPIIILFVKNNFFVNKKLIIILLMLIIACSSLIKIIDYSAYKNEKYNKYLQYSAARAYVVDYPIEEYSEKKYKNINISENDYKCIKNEKGQSSYLMADRNIFSKEKLVRIHQISKKYNFNLLDWLIAIITYGQSIFCILIGTVLLLSDEGKRKLFYVIQMGITYMSMHLLYIIQRYESKVFVNILMAGTICCAYYFFSNNKKHRIRKITIIAVALILVVYGERMGNGIVRQFDYYKKPYSETKAVREYINNNKNELFVLQNSNFNDCYYRFNGSVFSPMKKIDNAIALFDWDTYLDDYYYKMKKFGVKREDSLLLGMLEKKVYYISKVDSQEIGIIKKFIKEHGDCQKVSVKKTERIGNTQYCVYKFFPNNK